MPYLSACLRGVFTTRRYTNQRLPLPSYSGNEKITYMNQVTTDCADKHTAVLGFYEQAATV